MTTDPINEDETAEAPEGLIAIVAPTVTRIAGEQPGERTPFSVQPCCPEDQDCTHEPSIDPETGEPFPDQLTAEARNRILWATRPKNMLLMLLTARVAAAEADARLKLQLYHAFMDSALDPEDTALLWARLGDPTDALDEADVDALIGTFMGRWVPGRPTGPLSGREPLQRGTGRPSTGRSRSTGKTRKR